MTYDELVAEVVTLTGRPDLATTKIPVCIRMATLKAHQSDYYFKDLKEQPLIFGDSLYLQSINYRELFPRYRALKYLRKYEPVGQMEGKFFTLIDPLEARDEYDTNVLDAYYVAGDIIQLRSSTPLTNVLFAFYQNPDITAASFNSWVALEHPYAIVYEAAAALFKTIGYDEEAAYYQRTVQEQIAMLKLTNIVAEGG